jgi:hypothetical protein
MVKPPLSAKPVVELTSRNGGVHAWVAPAVVSMRKLREAEAGFAVLFVSTKVVCQPPPSTTWGIKSVCADCPNTGRHERKQRSPTLPFVMAPVQRRISSYSLWFIGNQDITPSYLSHCSILDGFLFHGENQLEESLDRAIKNDPLARQESSRGQKLVRVK